MRGLEWEGKDVIREVDDESDVTAEGLGRRDAFLLLVFRIDPESTEERGINV
jgi:hypothetical protein